jgi:hypothetical protein
MEFKQQHMFFVRWIENKSDLRLIGILKSASKLYHKH